MVMLVAGIAAGAESQTPAHDTCSRRIDALSLQLTRLQVELTTYRLQSQQETVNKLRTQLEQIVIERNQIEQEKASSHDDAAGADILLAKGDLGEDEKAELRIFVTTRRTDEDPAIQQRLEAVTEREANLRRQLEDEKSSLKNLQHRLDVLKMAYSR